MTRLDAIYAKLARAQSGLVAAAEAVPGELWKTARCEGAWSAAEVIAHVVMIERTVTGAAVRILQKQPKHIPVLKRFCLPAAIVEVRLVRMKTPIAVDAELVREKGTMLAELGQVRDETLALLDKNNGRDLSVYRWRHPFLGYLNAYQWFAFLGSHQIRHEKQMREVAASLPKVIAISQK
jgi:hypothetical protein